MHQRAECSASLDVDGYLDILEVNDAHARRIHSANILLQERGALAQ